MILNAIRWRVHDGLRNLAWPLFDCADCIGMSQYGCYCSYYDCIAPSEGPGDWHLWLRWLHGFLFPTSSPFWTSLDEPA